MAVRAVSLRKLFSARPIVYNSSYQIPSQKHKRAAYKSIPTAASRNNAPAQSPYPPCCMAFLILSIMCPLFSLCHPVPDLGKRRHVFYAFSFCTSSLRISFVRISLLICSTNSAKGFTPSSPAKRLLTDTVFSSSSFWPTTSI